jgi:8-oxo-dGTP pyrophosphatase MutT (NUDIX family)
MGRARRQARRETSAGGVIFRRGSDSVPHYLIIKDRYDNWGFPKGHVESDEQPAAAALREITEETALDQLILHGPIGVIHWYFSFRGRLIHKYCHFFLVESPDGAALPQEAEGISACQWARLQDALDRVAYANARTMLRKGAEMVDALVRAPGDER